MPAKSAKQYRFFQAVAHDPRFRSESKVPLSVAEEFIKATPKNKRKKENKNESK